MIAKLSVSMLIVGFISLVLPFPAMGEACTQPKPVCAARSAVFAISAFDPVGSATRIGDRILVTSRHVVADHAQIKLRLADQRTITARVIPSGYPGDLVLLESGDLPKSSILFVSDASTEEHVYAVGADLDAGRVRAYAPGSIRFMPDKEHPLARLHHDAQSQPGNSGGALVTASGQLVGIIASGGEGRYEAIPAGEIERLKKTSGPEFKDANDVMGMAVRECVLKIEELQSRRARTLDEHDAGVVSTECPRSRNRQLVDLAAQTLGRLGRFEESINLFNAAVSEDPNAVNSRIGLIISQNIAGRYEDSIAHIRWLLDQNIDDAQVLRFGLQAGVWGGDKELARRALTRIKEISPATASRAERFFNAPPPRPKRR